MCGQRPRTPPVLTGDGWMDTHTTRNTYNSRRSYGTAADFRHSTGALTPSPERAGEPLDRVGTLRGAMKYIRMRTACDCVTQGEQIGALRRQVRWWVEKRAALRRARCVRPFPPCQKKLDLFCEKRAYPPPCTLQTVLLLEVCLRSAGGRVLLRCCCKTLQVDNSRGMGDDIGTPIAVARLPVRGRQ